MNSTVFELVRIRITSWMMVSTAFLASSGCILGAIYTVDPAGDDEGPGSEGLPWKTVQKAADTMIAGDTVIVREGSYPERINTTNGGADDANRIVFHGEPGSIVLGWEISHPYVTVDQFEITGHSGLSVLEGNVEVNKEGDHFQLLNCTIRDGIQLVRRDFVFSAAGRTITSEEGGFLDAGFATGQIIIVGKGTNTVSVLNARVFQVESVSDSSITVTTASSAVVDEGPVHAYISGSYQYGLIIDNGAEGCLIRDNGFRNLGYDSWFIMGNDNLLENNVVESANGWDAMHFGGSNQVFSGNVFRDSPLLIYQNSPDTWENYSPIPYSNVLFTNNFISGFAGVIASQKGSGTASGLTFSHNVFVDVGGFFGSHPDTIFENNTFLRVAQTNNPVVSVARHPLYFATAAAATNIVIRNNIFVDCGQATGNVNETQVGWYEFGGSTASIITEGNFVTGTPPGYGSKTGWSETNPALNGGDPGFVNINDPIGPDGRPFTDDDGLRLLASSKLINAGVGGVTTGAYQVPGESVPGLTIELVSGNQVRLSWPDDATDWQLQGAPNVLGGWAAITDPPSLSNGKFQLTVGTSGLATYFRLSR